MNELVDYKKKVMEIRDELAVILKNNAEAADLKVFQDQTMKFFLKRIHHIMFLWIIITLVKVLLSMRFLEKKLQKLGMFLLLVKRKNSLEEFYDCRYAWN